MSDGDLLTLCVLQEAGNQVADGMAAVARVVLNRIGKTVFRLTAPPVSNVFYYNQQHRWRFYDITFDGAGQMTLPTSGSGSSQVANAPAGCYPGFQPLILCGQCSDHGAERCEFIGFWSAAVIDNIATRPRWKDNIVNRGTPMSSPANYGIALLGAVGYLNQGGECSGNTVTYCDLAFNCCDTLIANNDVSGWGFSAGLNFAASASCYRNRILFNKTHDSNTSPDRDGYWMDGIETWSTDSVVVGNESWNNIGSGISQNGYNCVCTNNLCYNNGTSNGGGISSGILVNGYADSTSTYGYSGGSGSLFIGNKCYDTRAQGSKFQLTGYRESVNTLTGISLVGNDFSGNETAPTQIESSSTTVLQGGSSAIGTVAAGVYADGAALALRAYNNTNGIAFQSYNGGQTWATFASSGTFTLATLLNLIEGISLSATAISNILEQIAGGTAADLKALGQAIVAAGGALGA